MISGIYILVKNEPTPTPTSSDGNGGSKVTKDNDEVSKMNDHLVMSIN